MQRTDSRCANCQSRMNAMSNPIAIEQYFTVLKECMEKEGLLDKPAQLYILYILMRLACLWITSPHVF